MSDKKYLYLFSEGNKDMREILGGKGANLAEMTNAGHAGARRASPSPPTPAPSIMTDGRQINDEITG